VSKLRSRQTEETAANILKSVTETGYDPDHLLPEFLSLAVLRGYPGLFCSSEIARLTVSELGRFCLVSNAILEVALIVLGMFLFAVRLWLNWVLFIVGF
jgi:hypothetical protein